MKFRQNEEYKTQTTTNMHIIIYCAHAGDESENVLTKNEKKRKQKKEN